MPTVGHVDSQARRRRWNAGANSVEPPLAGADLPLPGWIGTFLFTCVLMRCVLNTTRACHSRGVMVVFGCPTPYVSSVHSGEAFQYAAFEKVPRTWWRRGRV